MSDYLIRTDKAEKKMRIVRLGNLGSQNELVGMIYTDFNLYQGMRNISKEEIVDSHGKKLAVMRLFGDTDMISVANNDGILSAFSNDQNYTENGIVMPYRKFSRPQILERPEYSHLDRLGVTHAYFLDERSCISKIFCYERNGEISGIITERDDTKDDIRNASGLTVEQTSRSNIRHSIGQDDYTAALKGLSLMLAQKIEDQDYIFEFIRK
jgi:hypothetical protein